MKKKRKKRVWRSDMRSEEMAEWVIFSPTPKDFDYEEEEEEEERTLRVPYKSTPSHFIHQTLYWTPPSFPSFHLLLFRLNYPILFSKCLAY